MKKRQEKKKEEIKIQDRRRQSSEKAQSEKSQATPEHLVSEPEKKKSFEATSELDREKFRITKEVEEFVKDKALLSVCTQGREMIGTWADERPLPEVLSNDKFLQLDMVRECFRQKIGGDKVNRILVKDDYDTTYIAIAHIGDVRVVEPGSDLYRVWLKQTTGLILMSKSGILLPGRLDFPGRIEKR